MGSGPLNYRVTRTRIGALGLGGLEARMTVDGATAGDVFRVYIAHILCPTLRTGDLVGRDNLSAHRVASIREPLAARGARVLYLPPYSPDRSPLEPCWSTLKTALRAIGARTRPKLECALRHGLTTITAADAVAGFRIGATS